LNTTVATVDIDTKSTGLEFICRLHAEGEKKKNKKQADIEIIRMHKTHRDGASHEAQTRQVRVVVNLEAEKETRAEKRRRKSTRPHGKKHTPSEQKN
jgi:hypothetical protein